MLKLSWQLAWQILAAACLAVGGVQPAGMPANAGVGVNVKVTQYDVKTGAIIHEEEQHNLVVTAGLNLLATAIKTGTCAFPQYFGFGTSTTAASAGQTDLVAPSFRAALTLAVQDATNPIVTEQYYMPSGTGNGVTYNEVGLFTASSGGTMYARVVLSSAIVKTSAVAVSFVWTLTWAAI